tara:strand:+ start:202 stop:726 length:525 start_codon:yes stop_codon:yes gene_type:complete
MKLTILNIIFIVPLTLLCQDNVLWDHGIVIKDQKTKKLKYALAEKPIEPQQITIEKETKNIIIETDPIKLYNKGLESYNQGYYNEAKKYLQLAYSKKQKNKKTTYYLAQTYEKLGSYKKAIDILEKTIDPDEHTLMFLSILYKRNNQPKKAQVYIKKLLTTHPLNQYKYSINKE